MRQLDQHMENGDLYSRHVGCDNLGIADNKEHISYGGELVGVDRADKDFTPKKL